MMTYNPIELQMKRLKRHKQKILLDIEDLEIERREFELSKIKYERDILSKKGQIEVCRNRMYYAEPDSVEYMRARRDVTEAILELQDKELQFAELQNRSMQFDADIEIKKEILQSADNKIVEFMGESHLMLDMARNSDWPPAVLEMQMVTSEEDKKERAESILSEFISLNLKGKKFLDFGCGDGSVACAAQADVVVGYDIVRDEKWDKYENILLTDSLDKVAEHAPYDVVLLYDVMDHATDPLEMMKQVRDMVSATSVIYLRNHPWTARHGGHLYEKLNRAFVHLTFTEEELKKDGLEMPFTQKVYDPVMAYRYWMQGFKVDDEFVHKAGIEPFFMGSSPVRKRMDLLYNAGNDVLQINFVDYKITL